jgi:hypothetical protein
MKKNLIYLLITLLVYIMFSCTTSKCSLGYCSIEQKKLQSYNDYKKENRKQYIVKISKVESKYIDIKSRDIKQVSMTNPKFR